MSADITIALPIHAPAEALAALGALPHEVACLARSVSLRTRSVMVTRAGYVITPHVGSPTHLPHGWMGCELTEQTAEHTPHAHDTSARQVGAGVAVRCVCWHVVSGSHTADCPAADAGDLLPPWREVQVEVREYAGKNPITGKPRFEAVTVRKLVPPRETPVPVQAEQAAQPAHVEQPSSPELVAVLDTETTGLKRGHDGARITEIAVAITDLATGEIVKRASSLLSIDVPVPADITALTGITSAMLAGKPALIDMWPRVVAFVGDLPVIAHNAAFDRGQLEDGLGRAGIIATEWPRWRWRDSVTMAKRVEPGLPTYSLHDNDKGHGLIRRLSLGSQTAHRALGDVLTVCALLRELRVRAGKPFSEWRGPAHVWGVGVEKPERPAGAERATRPTAAAKPTRAARARSKEAVSEDQPDLFTARTHGATT